MAPYEFKVGTITDSDGSTPITSVGEAADILAIAEIDEDTNKLKLKLRSALATDYADAVDWTTGYTIALSATDANKESADSSITIRPNRAPRLVTGVTASDGVLASPNEAYVLGTMSGDTDIDTTNDEDDPRVDGAASCAMFNMCELTLFEDDGENDFVVMVTSGTSGKYSWANDKGKLVLTGLVSTWDPDEGANGAHDPVEVRVKATDNEGLASDTYTFTVTVDAPPALSENAPGFARSVEYELGTTGNTLITQAGAVLLFKDPEGIAAVAAFDSSNEAVVTIDPSTGAVTPVSRGNAVFTITGTTGEVNNTDTDGLGQSAKIEVSVTIK